MVHLKVAILIATLLIIDPTQPDEAADLGNLDFTELFSTDENKYPKLVDLNSVEATKAPVKKILIHASANLRKLLIF